MAGLKKKLFKNSKFEPVLWLSYLGDIFCLWTKGVDKLKELFNYFNAFHSSMTFTTEYSEKQIRFVDVIVTKSASREKLC